MKTSKEGIELIKKFEGCRLKAYKALESEKYFTIGYGHYGQDVKEGMTITQKQAEELLTKDLEKFEGYVEKYAGNLGINQNQFNALVSFAYNCGAGNLRKLVNGRTLSEIADALPDYNHAGGKVLAVLTKRRNAERELFLKPEILILIGSARIDENGKATGGKGGDQKQKSTPDYTGEVSVQEFYVHSKSWIILRAKDKETALKLAEAMLFACNNKNVGYNQIERAQIITYGTKSHAPCNCDCGTLVRECVIEAAGVDPGNFTTANEVNALMKTGLFDNLGEYKPLMKLYDGDILTTKTKGHTAIVVAGYNCNLIGSNCNLAENDNVVSKKGNKIEITIPTVRKGDTGKAVCILQAILGAEVSGSFDDATLAKVKEFQKSKWLNVDGIVGIKTWSAALEKL